MLFKYRRNKCKPELFPSFRFWREMEIYNNNLERKKFVLKTSFLENPASNSDVGSKDPLKKAIKDIEGGFRF